jgi:hypothetical protein
LLGPDLAVAATGGADALEVSAILKVCGRGAGGVAMELPLPPGAFMTPDHRYYWNGKGPVPSVTTVLGIMDKPAVVQWKAKETARAILTNPDAFYLRTDDPTYASSLEDRINQAVKEADKARDAAASLGSSVHLLADLEGMPLGASEKAGKGFQVSDDTIPYLTAYRGFLGRYSASSIVSSEHIVWSLNGYAGTYDLIMLIDGELWLIDIKTSKGYYPEYGLQLAGYRWADSIILPNDPRVYPMPQIQRTGVLHLRPDQYSDTGWRLIEYSTTYEKDYIAFLACLELHKWKSEGRFTKSQLSKP